MYFNSRNVKTDDIVIEKIRPKISSDAKDKLNSHHHHPQYQQLPQQPPQVQQHHQIKKK